MKSLNLLGKIDMNQVANRIGHGKAIKPIFFSTLVAIISAALSASIKNGIGQVLPSVMRERTNPGHTTQTFMPYFFKSPRKASP